MEHRYGHVTASILEVLPEKQPEFGEIVWNDSKWAKRCRTLSICYGKHLFEGAMSEAMELKYSPQNK